jgi:phenolic acid decarboxylase
MDDEDCEIKHLHFLSNDYVLKRGVCFAPNSVTAQCNTDECVQETFIDLEAELAEY